MMNAILILSAAIAVQGELKDPDRAQPQRTGAPRSQEAAPTVVVPTLPEKEKLTPLERKLDPALRGVMRAVRKGGAAAARKAAVEQSISLDNDLVAVRIVAKSARNVPRLERRLAKLGGSHTSTFHENVYGKLPIRNIARLASEESVVRLSTDLPLEEQLQKTAPPATGKNPAGSGMK